MVSHHCKLDETRISISDRSQDTLQIVQPGIGWQEVNEQLASRGIKLFFPVSQVLSALAVTCLTRPSPLTA